MKNLLLIVGVSILGYLGWQYFRTRTPIEQHLHDEKDLQILGTAVNSVTTAAVPVNAHIGVKPLTTLELNPVLARSFTEQFSPLETYMKLGDTAI